MISMQSYKQVLIVRADLKLSKGKMAAQAAHASLEAYKKAEASDIEEWESSGTKKIVLKVADEKELMEIYNRLKENKMKPSLIKDAGHTEIPAGTTTCVGVGPVEENIVDKVTGKLKMA